MRVLLFVALGCVAAAIAVGVARPWDGHSSTGASAETSLRPHGFLVVARNDGPDNLRIAQVTVNDAFVGFRSTRLMLAPHSSARLVIDYGWVKFEPYEIGVLTSTGEIIQSEVGGAGG